VLRAPGATDYLDVGLANGVDHVYRLQYLLQSGALSPYSETIATPGPLRPWVSDFSSARLLRITADARVAVPEPTSPLQSPSDIAADTPRGRIWIADTFAGQVIGYAPATGVEIRLGGLQDPQAIAVDPDSGSVWVCDGSLNQVLKYDPAVPGGPVAFRPNVANPLGLALDVVDGSVWVCERNGDKLRHLDAFAQPIAAADVAAPSRVAVDSLTRSAWVTSFTSRQVVRVMADAQPRDTLGGFSGPIGISIDARRGRIWIADAAANRIVVLDRAGNELFRVPNLSEVREIAIDLATGEAWATCPGEGALVHVSADGVVLLSLRGMSEPYDVVIERFP
jgi:streptogramin lyase